MSILLSIPTLKVSDYVYHDLIYLYLPFYTSALQPFKLNDLGLNMPSHWKWSAIHILDIPLYDPPIIFLPPHKIMCPISWCDKAATPAWPA